MDILILEDDKTLAEVYGDFLEDAGHKATVTCSNAEAIEKLTQFKYDLLVIDLMIVDETSIPVLDFASYMAPDADVILLTGSDLFPNGELNCSVGRVSLRVQKPINFDHFIALIEHFKPKGKIEGKQARLYDESTSERRSQNYESVELALS